MKPSVLHPVVLLALIVVMGGAMFAVASEDEISDAQRLARFRAQFESSASRSLLPELENYAELLQRLEQQFVQRSDWRSAKLARDERLAVEHRIEAARARLAPEVMVEPRGASDTSEKQPNQILLIPASAQLKGTVYFSPEKLALGNWKSDSKASWSVSELSAGGYEVLLEYASNGRGGVFQIAEEFFTLSGELEDTGGSDTFQTTRLGTLKVRTPASGIRIEITSSSNDEDGSPYVRRIILVPSNL